MEGQQAALTATKAWSANQIHFQVWLAVPPSVREPRSQRELAAHLEVHEVTLSDWKKLPGWHDAVYALAVDRVIGDLVPVLHAQVAAAKKGSLPHAQWLFELAGKWSPKQPLSAALVGDIRIRIEAVDDRGDPSNN